MKPTMRINDNLVNELLDEVQRHLVAAERCNAASIGGKSYDHR
jgi:hypothetical protein